MQNKLGATKLVNGFKWPAYDEACAAVVFDSIPDLERAIGFCQNKRTVIQAGGNCGVWARHLADIFKSVWTWEPDPLNYHCLSHNTIYRPNVFCVNAALGNQRGETSMNAPEQNNCGALQLEPYVTTRKLLNPVQVQMIDDYQDQLGHVDLMYLDLEGYELHAIAGAIKVIERCQPVIAVEDKGLSERYGVARGDVLRYIQDTFNYEVCDQYARDYVLRPKHRPATLSSARPTPVSKR